MNLGKLISQTDRFFMINGHWKTYNYVYKPIRNFIWDFHEMTFKQFLLSRIWNFIKSIDKGENYNGETAPYCGHAYSGYNGKYIIEHYNEIGGGGETTFKIFGCKLYYHSEEGYYFGK